MIIIGDNCAAGAFVIIIDDGYIAGIGDNYR